MLSAGSFLAALYGSRPGSWRPSMAHGQAPVANPLAHYRILAAALYDTLPLQDRSHPALPLPWEAAPPVELTCPLQILLPFPPAAAFSFSRRHGAVWLSLWGKPVPSHKQAGSALGASKRQTRRAFSLCSDASDSLFSQSRGTAKGSRPMHHVMEPYLPLRVPIVAPGEKTRKQ